MNKVKKIGFDLDGVLIDHQHNRVSLAHEFGYDNIFSNMSVKVIREAISKSDYEQIQELMYGEISLKADAIEGSREVLVKLKGKAELFVISRRNVKSHQFALKWLENNFAFLPKNIYFVDSDKDKGLVAEKIGLDVFIDDKLIVLENIGKGTRKFLFDRFLTQKDKKIDKVEVVHFFEEFFESLAL